MNPLRGFITHGRLFVDLDDEGQGPGIELYQTKGVRSLVQTVLDVIRGRAEPVTVGGETVTVDRVSAEAFFDRNAERFQGVLDEGMDLQEKLIRLCGLKQREAAGFNFSGLPRGLFEEFAFPGAEGREKVIGLVQQFLSLIDALEDNGFQLPQLRDMIFQSQEKGFLQFDRDGFFNQILEENHHRLSELTMSFGRPEIRKLAEFLIHRLEELSQEQ